MMVLGRWMVAAIVVVGLAPVVFGQSPGKPPSHRKKSNVVQPDKGAPPDQAVNPDQSAPLSQTPNYDPPPPPPRPPDPDPPPPIASLPQSPPPALVTAAPRTATRPMTPEEQQLEKDSTQLLNLVRELKEEVDKAGIDTLSLAALRKADEIQRLSKNLKERLKLQPQAGPK